MGCERGVLDGWAQLKTNDLPFEGAICRHRRRHSSDVSFHFPAFSSNSKLLFLDLSAARFPDGWLHLQLPLTVLAQIQLKMSFFIDRSGNQNLQLNEATEKGKEIDFIPLGEGEQKRGKNFKHKGGQRRGGGQKRKVFVKGGVGDVGDFQFRKEASAREEAILQDYIENCDEDDDLMAALRISMGKSSKTTLASMNMEDDLDDTLALGKMKMASSSDHINQEEESSDIGAPDDLPEQGYYEALTRLHEDDELDEDDMWQDTDEQVSDDSIVSIIEEEANAAAGDGIYYLLLVDSCTAHLIRQYLYYSIK